MYEEKMEEVKDKSPEMSVAEAYRKGQEALEEETIGNKEKVSVVAVPTEKKQVEPKPIDKKAQNVTVAPKTT